MGSALVWLDFSERERRDALNFIDLFRDKTTRDELGLGTIRDALADRLFPGTSTIQTRARYFLFVPWLYRDLERRKVAQGDVARVARDKEVRLIESLAESGETSGLIGLQARAKLKRLPSSVYWQGLGEWGIREVSIGLADYHRYFSLFSVAADKGKGDDDLTHRSSDRVRPLWHEGIPDPPPDFPDKATFALRGDEADYLTERIFTRAPGTMLAAALRLGIPGEGTDVPWEYELKSKLPTANQIELDHARRFAILTQGAPLLYNLLLAELTRNEERQAYFRAELANWQLTTIVPVIDDLKGWDRTAFWRLIRSTYPRLGLLTRRFTDQWIDLVLANGRDGKLADDTTARQLVTMRERAIKGGLSRFTSSKALGSWNGDSGTGIANFRWHRVQTIVNDISAGASHA